MPSKSYTRHHLQKHLLPSHSCTNAHTHGHARAHAHAIKLKMAMDARVATLGWAVVLRECEQPHSNLAGDARFCRLLVALHCPQCHSTLSEHSILSAAPLRSSLSTTFCAGHSPQVGCVPRSGSASPKRGGILVATCGCMCASVRACMCVCVYVCVLISSRRVCVCVSRCACVCVGLHAP